MKLLFDQNLSFKLCQNRPSLILIPKSNHVRLLGLLEDGDLSPPRHYEPTGRANARCPMTGSAKQFMAGLVRLDCFVASAPRNDEAPHGSLSNPSPSPLRLSGKPIPSSGVSKMMKVAVLAVRS
jgi:hypothetical protein